MTNPFAIVRSRRIRLRAVRLKAELRARHDAGPEDYLSDNPGRLPAGHKVPDALARYENYIPVAVRRQGLRANWLVRAFRQKTRPHRRTGRPRGPSIDDSALARDYYQRIDRGMKPDEGKRELARAICDAERIELKSALRRMRKAIRRLG